MAAAAASLVGRDPAAPSPLPGAAAAAATCIPAVSGAAPPLEGGVAATGLGTGAPAYYELGQPTGAAAGQPPKGLMILIHGGSWIYVGPHDSSLERTDADRWRARGWETLNITYGGCARSIPDVLAFHDLARALVGPTLPICAEGRSAGAQLAVLMAELRPDVSCVIGMGTPADFATLRGESASQPQKHGAQALAGMVDVAFAGDPAADPATHPSIRGRLLLATGEADWLVPQAQATDLAAAIHAVDPGHVVDVLTVAGGSDSWFVHGPASSAALRDFFAHEERLVSNLPPVPPPPPPPAPAAAATTDRAQGPRPVS